MSLSEYTKLNKAIVDNNKELLSIQKENKDLKKIVKTLERKINIILDKIQEFEVVLDAADLLEEQIEKQEAEQSEYNTDWNPYDDEDFHIEDYENYDDDDDDVIRGY
jgi:archaellum component FlaC|tara:strand:+ start:970 stop:1290 length:321 start_codon:yes stop_codon:yes gene_type:complete